MEIINKENFAAKIEKGVVLVDFFANWCMPCKMLAPVLEEVGQLYGDQLRIYKVDVDKDNQLASQFNVMSIPNLVLFKDGKAVNQHIGFASKEDIVEFIKTSLISD
ncbi:MAG: thioredoxin [Erysipelotrichaceae bacterium]